MSRLDDPRLPLEKILTPKHIIKRLERLEEEEIQPTQISIEYIETVVTNTPAVTGSGDVISDVTSSTVGNIVVMNNTDGKHVTDSGIRADLDVDSNLGIGSPSVLGDITSGAYNTAFGVEALELDTDGQSNTAVGHRTLAENTGGDSNTAVGYIALTSNVSGSSNTAIGANALLSNVDGLENTAIGIDALSSNVSGDNNLAAGNDALLTNITGSNNIAIGNKAGRYETGSDKFFVDSRDRTNEAGDRAGAILYGVMNDNSALQQLTVNGDLIVTGSISGGSSGLTHPQIMARVSLGF